jgi:hypothetical protein
MTLEEAIADAKRQLDQLPNFNVSVVHHSTGDWSAYSRAYCRDKKGYIYAYCDHTAFSHSNGIRIDHLTLDEALCIVNAAL